MTDTPQTEVKRAKYYVDAQGRYLGCWVDCPEPGEEGGPTLGAIEVDDAPDHGARIYDFGLKAFLPLDAKTDAAMQIEILDAKVGRDLEDRYFGGLIKFLPQDKLDIIEKKQSLRAILQG